MPSLKQEGLILYPVHLTKCSDMRGMQDACGRSVYIIPSPDGSANQRPACRRPGSSDHLKRPWQHIGTRPYWESMTEWVAATVGVWPHNRDLINEPLQPNECIYSRQDSVSGLHSTFVRKQYQSLTGGSAAVMQIWQKSLGERYPSLTHHVIGRCERRCFC